MNNLTTLKPLKPIHLFFFWLSSLVIYSCVQPPSSVAVYKPYTTQELEEWQAIIRNDTFPIQERLQIWIKYADITSVYNNIYTDLSIKEKQELLHKLESIIPPQDHVSIVLRQYLAAENEWKKGHTETAANYFKTSEQLVDSLWPTYPEKRMIYHYLGVLNGELGNPIIAEEYILKCIQAAEQAQDEHLLGLTYWNMAIHHGNLGDYTQEALYLDTAMQLAEKLDYAYLKANILATKSNNYQDRKFYQQADSLYQVTLDFCKAPSLVFVRYLTLLNYGNLTLYKGNHQQAYDYFMQCRTYFQQIENIFLLAATNSQLVALFIDKNQLEGLAPFIQETADLQQKLGLYHEYAASIDLLSTYHEKKRNYAQSLKYARLYNELREEIINEEKVREMAKVVFINEHKAEQEQQQLIQQRQWLGLLLLSLSLFFALIAFQIKRKANQEIQSQKRQLEQLNIAKDRMLSIIAHDLKKPMISFRGISQKVNYLLAKQDYSRLLALGNDIDKEVNSLNALVDNLLKWAMLQKNVLAPIPEEIHLTPVVDQVFALFQQTAIQKNITLTKTISATHKVLVDENILSTILRNLVDNAIKFSQPNSTVHIGSREVEEGLYISVNDTGVGMALEQIEQLFLLQKEKSTKGTSGEMGAGLGLHLIKELTTLCKGQIEVISQLGKGTSFRLYLPK